MAGPPRFATVLFDLDGTLTDPKVGITRGVQHALAAVGVVVDDADSLVGYIGPPIHDGLAEHHAVPDADIEPAVAAYREYYREQGMYENVVHPRVPELLADLQAAGVTLAVATSKPDSVAQAVLDHFGLTTWFAFIGGASLDGARRTKADIITHTLAHLGVAAAERSSVVIVGDREHDIAGAKATGIASVGVRWGYAVPGELERAGADAIVDSVAELADVLLSRP